MTPDERTAWLERRRTGIGASDIAAIVHKVYGGQYAVVADKLGHDTDLGDNLDEKQRGLAWETRIADAVQALTGMFVVGEQFEAAHRDMPHHKATVDGFLSADAEASLADVAAVLEIKTLGTFVDAPWGKWVTQVRFQMYVADVDRGLIAACRIDDDTQQITDIRFSWVERDHELEADLVAMAEETWAYVQRGELPEPDCASALAYVNKLTAQANAAKTTVVDLEDIGHAVRRFGEIKQAIKKAEDERKTLEAQIKARMGDATKGAASGWRISFSKNASVLDSLGEEAVLLAHPELGKTVLDKDLAKRTLGKELDEFRSPVGARRLTITPPKETS